MRRKRRKNFVGNSVASFVGGGHRLATLAGGGMAAGERSESVRAGRERPGGWTKGREPKCRATKCGDEVWEAVTLSPALSPNT